MYWRLLCVAAQVAWEGHCPWPHRTAWAEQWAHFLFWIKFSLPRLNACGVFKQFLSHSLITLPFIKLYQPCSRPCFSLLPRWLGVHGNMYLFWKGQQAHESNFSHSWWSWRQDCLIFECYLSLSCIPQVAATSTTTSGVAVALMQVEILPNGPRYRNHYMETNPPSLLIGVCIHTHVRWKTISLIYS